MLKATRVTALVVMPVLFAAWVILWIFPSRTAALWAWPLKSDMTAVTMGSGYLGGVWFFYRIATARRTNKTAGGLLAAFVFTVLLGLATIIHWEVFNHDHVSFWAWAFLYFASPLFLPFYFRAALAHATPMGRGPVVPRLARAGMVAVGVTQTVAVVTWFLFPSVIVQRWPWHPMPPAAMRTITGFVGFCATLLLWVLVDRHYEAVQAGVEALGIGLFVCSIGAVVHRADFTGPLYARVLYVAAFAFLALLFGGLIFSMRGRSDPWREAARVEPAQQAPA